jgi:molybdopterin converting factor subunit 1
MKRTRIENKAKSTIRVKVLYFAQVREAAGIHGEEIILVKDLTLKNLISKIEEGHPGILQHREDIQLAVNRNVAGKNSSLKEGDQIAVFPPVSGG